MSRSNDAILEADKKGYIISHDGKIVTSHKGNVLSLHQKNSGYYAFSINFKGRPTKVKVHKFQAFKKFGHKIFQAGMQVRHLDGDSTNNHWDNLEIGSQSDNFLDISKETRHFRAKNAASYTRKLSPKQIENFLLDRANGMTYKELMQKYNVSKGTCSHICNAKFDYTK